MNLERLRQKLDAGFSRIYARIDRRCPDDHGLQRRAMVYRI